MSFLNHNKRIIRQNLKRLHNERCEAVRTLRGIEAEIFNDNTTLRKLEEAENAPPKAVERKTEEEENKFVCDIRDESGQPIAFASYELHNHICVASGWRPFFSTRNGVLYISFRREDT